MGVVLTGALGCKACRLEVDTSEIEWHLPADFLLEQVSNKRACCHVEGQCRQQLEAVSPGPAWRGKAGCTAVIVLPEMMLYCCE